MWWCWWCFWSRKKPWFTSRARSWVQHPALLSRHCQYLYFSFCKYGFLFHCKVFPALYFPYFSKTISHRSLLDSCYQNLRSIKPLVVIILFSNNKGHGEVTATNLVIFPFVTSLLFTRCIVLAASHHSIVIRWSVLTIWKFLNGLQRWAQL